jgi:shikimate dehydrogenase
MDPGTGTRLIALLGDPVAHSLSPKVQNAAIRAAGVDAVYLALRCDARSFEGLLRGIAGAGGAGNVTVPHKQRAAALIDNRTDAVERTGSCNTFWCENDELHGDNTDVDGFSAAARELIGPPAGARVLILGAGGAARAAVVSLLQGRADAIHVHARGLHRAAALREHLDPRGRRVTVLEQLDPLRREGYDLVVNATPLGLGSDDEVPLDLDLPSRIGAVLDLTYRPGTTLWVRQARDRGLPAADGTGMLLHQGAAAFRRWFQRYPDLEVMRAAAGR